MKLNEKNTKSDSLDNDELEFMVGEDHPGYGYAYMRENRHRKIPLVSIPEGFMCRIKDLHIGSNEVDAEVAALSSPPKSVKPATPRLALLRRGPAVRL